MNFADLLTEDRRLSLLRLLAEAPGTSANTFVLASGLRAVGHSCSGDLVESDVAWLAEQSLVIIEDLGKVRVAHLTQRGEDVSAGRAVVPGVKRPVPGV